MSIPSISDQVFAASEKFHKARIAYEVERDALRKLEQQLLRHTEDYQALPEQAEYVGDGTWRAWGNTFSAGKKGARPQLLGLRLQPHRQEACLLPGSPRGRGLPRRILGRRGQTRGAGTRRN